MAVEQEQYFLREGVAGGGVRYEVPGGSRALSELAGLGERDTIAYIHTHSTVRLAATRQQTKCRKNALDCIKTGENSEPIREEKTKHRLI